MRIIIGRVTERELLANKENTWSITKKLLNESKFLDIIKNFDKVIEYNFI
jgi:hypothetical protein